jgi:hypothetical protein
MVRNLIEEGKLVEILGSYESPPSPLSIVYPHRRNLNARLRVFIDWIQGLVAGDPDLALQSPRADRRLTDSLIENDGSSDRHSDEGVDPA